MINETLYLTRDCPATLIPAGDMFTLAKGSPVNVNQALGGSVTITAPNGMFRIARENFDALGEEAGIWLKQQDGSTDEELDGPFSEDKVWAVLRNCFDPEIPVNIVDLGLIYDLTSEESDAGKHRVSVQMTLTAQGCGMGPVIAADAKEKIEGLEDVDFADVQIVWDPPWNPKMISEAGKQKLGLT
ncbi:MAG: iron-sulfur cluster assembly protein [Verrucomicrobiota bacterium]